jgi:citrate lyase beta subunit
VLAAHDKALSEGVGAVTVDGKMIDVPVSSARGALDRARAGDRHARGKNASLGVKGTA